MKWYIMGICRYLQMNGKRPILLLGYIIIMKTKSFYYVSRIGGKEKRKEYRCDLWNMERVIKHFKKDIEKSKKWKEQQKIDKIKEDF